jgi:hypothetical protein
MVVAPQVVFVVAAVAAIVANLYVYEVLFHPRVFQERVARGGHEKREENSSYE